MNEALRLEIVKAIQNQNAAVTVIIQLRDGGMDETLQALAAQLTASNEALAAVLAGGGGEGGDPTPPPGPPEAS